MNRASGPKHGMYIHGHSGKSGPSPTYNSWRSMVERCTNPSNIGYADYGGRGITICDDWYDFDLFLRDMGPRPDGYTLDRIDTDSGYAKWNCRWATPEEQARNRSNVPVYTFAHLPLALCEWSELLGIPVGCLSNRIHKSKWSLEKALCTPVKTNRAARC